MKHMCLHVNTHSQWPAPSCFPKAEGELTKLGKLGRPQGSPVHFCPLPSLCYSPIRMLWWRGGWIVEEGGGKEGCFPTPLT